MGALLCLPCTTNADEVIKDVLSWHKVIADQPKKGKWVLIFKNPTVANVKYVAVITTSHRTSHRTLQRISHYMKIGKDIHLFENILGTFVENKMTESAKEKVWLYLQRIIGLHKL